MHGGGALQVVELWRSMRPRQHARVRSIGQAVEAADHAACHFACELEDALAAATNPHAGCCTRANAAKRSVRLAMCRVRSLAEQPDATRLCYSRRRCCVQLCSWLDLAPYWQELPSHPMHHVDKKRKTTQAAEANDNTPDKTFQAGLRESAHLSGAVQMRHSTKRG